MPASCIYVKGAAIPSRPGRIVAQIFNLRTRPKVAAAVVCGQSQTTNLRQK